MSGAELYPRGSVFPFIIWDARSSRSAAAPTATEITAVANYQTFNGVQSYNAAAAVPDFPTLADAGSLRSFFPLARSTTRINDNGASVIAAAASLPGLSFWEMPEEVSSSMREWPINTAYAAQTRISDPSQRPNFLLCGETWDTKEVKKIVTQQKFDILGVQVRAAHVYNEKGFQRFYPNAWVRYKIEAALDAIAEKEKTEGPDYLNDQKTLYAVIEAGFRRLGEGGRHPTVESVSHNLIQSIISGARGIVVYSYADAIESAEQMLVLDRINFFGKILLGGDRLGAAVLTGEKWGVSISIEEGPESTETFTPNLEKQKRYATISSTGIVFKSWFFLLVASSSEIQDVKFQILDLPENIEDGFDLVSGFAVVKDGGSYRFNLKALGVSIVKARRLNRIKSQLIVIVPTAGRVAAGEFADLDIKDTQGTAMYSRRLGPNSSTVSHYAGIFIGEDSEISKTKARKDSVSEFYYFEIDLQERILKSTNHLGTQSQINNSWGFTNSIAALGLVKVT